jgi:transposase
MPKGAYPVGMHKQYVIRLTPDERKELQARTRAGTMKVRAFKRAQILLKADARRGDSVPTEAEIAEAVGVSVHTVVNVCTRYRRDGLAVVLQGRYTGHNPRLLDGEAEAHLIALTCSEPPEEREHWTMQLLADRMVKLEYVEHLSDETVRKTLKKTHSSRG